MRKKPTINDIVKFKYQNILDDPSTFVGRIIKIKPNRQFEIYLDDVVEVKNIKSYGAVFKEQDKFSHKQITEAQIIVNFGDVSKEDFIQDFPEYMI